MKSIQRTLALALIVTATGLYGGTFAVAETQMDSKPGPAYTMIDGKISHIEGNVYTVQSESANYQNMGSTTNVNEVRIVVSTETKKIRGEKKVGDKIRAEVTQGGFANSIQ
jgi:hypothetical protein